MKIFNSILDVAFIMPFLIYYYSLFSVRSISAPQQLKKRRQLESEHVLCIRVNFREGNNLNKTRDQSQLIKA